MSELPLPAPHSRLAKALLFLAAVGLLLGLDHVLRVRQAVNNYIFATLIYIGINIVLAVGLNLINGYAGQFSLGHAGFMAIGGYASAAVTLKAPWPEWVRTLPSVDFPLVFPLAMLAGGLAAAAAGWLVGLPTLRLKGDYLAIVTLGFGEIVRVFFLNFDELGGARGLPGLDQFTNFFWVYLCALLAIVLSLNLASSSHGRAILALREDELAAEVMGISTTRYKVAAFVLGAFLAGVGGCLFAHYLTILNPTKFDFILSTQVVVMVILGGMGSTSGVVLAAILLTLLPELLRMVPAWAAQASTILPNWMEWPLGLLGEPAMRMILYSVLMILLMIFRPNGLMGDREIRLKTRWGRSTRSAIDQHAPVREEP